MPCILTAEKMLMVVTISWPLNLYRVPKVSNIWSINYREVNVKETETTSTMLRRGTDVTHWYHLGKNTLNFQFD